MVWQLSIYCFFNYPNLGILILVICWIENLCKRMDMTAPLFWNSISKAKYFFLSIGTSTMISLRNTSTLYWKCLAAGTGLSLNRKTVFRRATTKFFQAQGKFCAIKSFDKLSSRAQDKNDPQGKRLEIFLLHTLETTFWLENLTQRWIQARFFSHQIRVFFRCVLGIWYQIQGCLIC